MHVEIAKINTMIHKKIKICILKIFCIKFVLDFTYVQF